jgi:hypothetical protein
MNRRSMLTATTMALLLGVALPKGDAVGQTAKDLVGTWTWASVELTRSDGTKTQPFGATPKGYVIFDSNGRFAYLLTRPGRPKFASNTRDDATPEEYKATVQGSLAYTGTYSVSDKTLIFSVEASTFPNAEGADQKRSVLVTADEMRWSNPAPTTGGAGAKAEAVLKRVK